MAEDEKKEIENAVWSLVFMGIGTIIFMNRPAANGGFIIVGTISFMAGCYFAAKLIFSKGQ